MKKNNQNQTNFSLIKKSILLAVITTILFFPSSVAASSVVGTVNGSTVNIRAAANTTSTIVATARQGDQITVLNPTSPTASTNVATCPFWFRVNFRTHNNVFICGSFVTLPNASHVTNLMNAGFPRAYAERLSPIQAQHPNWRFVPLRINHNWNDILDRQTRRGVSFTNGNQGRRSTESHTFNFATNVWTPSEGTTWFNANRQAVGHQMDPRNFLNERNIFMFKSLQNNATYTDATIRSLLSTTRLNDFDTNHVRHVQNAANQHNVNAVHLAARIRQEIGSTTLVISGGNFTSPLDGRVYRGFFNPCNIGAGSGQNTAQRGLDFARGFTTATQVVPATTFGRPWNTLERSIRGCAQFLSERYIGRNQDSLYLQKFNNNNGLNAAGTHQFMTNIAAPQSESGIIFNTYNSFGILRQPHTFRIPVYNNMPAAPVAAPPDGNPNNRLRTLTVNGTAVPGWSVNRDVRTYNVNVGSNTRVTILATMVASTSSVTGTGTFDVPMGTSTRTVRVTAQNGAIRTYTINITRTTAPAVPEEVSSIMNRSRFTIRNNGIDVTGINPGTTGTGFQNTLRALNGGATVSVRTAANAAKANSARLGTGDRITVTNGASTRTYTVIILGDINGDGHINASDFVMIRNHIMGTSRLSGARLRAADTNRSGTVDASDFVRVRNHIMGSSTIRQ